jgi:hypothetical protein
MPDRRSGDGGSRLSPQTLIVASLASLTAAILTSHFWRGGTPIAAALSPVIVAVASELYSRPARRISEFSSRATTRSRAARNAPAERERVSVGARSRSEERPQLREPELGSGPIRVYRSEAVGCRRFHLKVVLATAAIAFVIAAAVLTLPELVFGGSVASHGRTTFFGGGGSSKHGSHSKSTKTQSTPTTSTKTTTTPKQGTTGPSAPPAQTAPQATTPTPTSVTPAPQGTSTPAQTPSGQ